MPERRAINLATIETVAKALGEINDDVVYVGGAVVSLYVTENGAEQARPTMDIDISVQVSSYAGMEILRQKLAGKGIYPTPSETVMYRYSFGGILLDFIPFEDTPLGPTNRWLKPGFDKAYPVNIGVIEIKILPVSFFLATKWEAFKSRGGDYRMSHDFEDIIYIINNNSDLVDDVFKGDEKVRDFLKEMGEEILSNPFLNEIIECHLTPFTASERRGIIIEKLKKISSIN